jgi:hypothetical protein
MRDISDLTAVKHGSGENRPHLGRPGKNAAATGGTATPDYQATRRTVVTRRTVLYLARASDDKLLKGLHEHGWTVMLATSAAEANRVVRPESVAVGLVDMDGFTARELPGLEQSLRQSSVGWVALVSAARLIDPQVRRLVRNYCFDYLKSPSTPQSIDYVMRHAFGT